MTDMTLHGLTDYLCACRDRLPPGALIVTGHTAPDTDAAVSAIAEAYRRLVAEGTPAVPLIRAHALPGEIAWLLGDAAPLIPTEDRPDIAAAIAGADTRFVLTDHHEDPLCAGRTVAIVDHHIPPEGRSFCGIDTLIRPVGAATTLVVLRCREQELVPDAPLARILLGGILADTEGLTPAKTRPPDADAAAWLTALSGADPAALFAQLRRQLLDETDLPTLYRRDYRLFCGEGGAPLLGFAVLKVWEHTAVDEPALAALLDADRRQRGTVACLAKISRYTDDGLHSETYLLSAPPPIARRMMQAMTAAVQIPPPGDPYRLTLPPGGRHLSRKRLAPLLLPLLEP